MPTPIVTPEEVQAYIKDHADNNHLLDGQEFSPLQINLAIDLAFSEWNMIPPLSADTPLTVDSKYKSLFMSGTLYKLFAGASALLARNHMEYSDGGITIPIEERMQLYTALAAMYQTDFQSTAKGVKIHLNIEAGWGEVRSDQASFPTW